MKLNTSYIVLCIGVLGLSFVGYRLIMVFIGMKYQVNYLNNLPLSSYEIISILEKNVYKQTEKSKFAISSCSRYLAGVIYKLRLNT